ncbi:hypothetical protein HNQ51_003377 [Inhella inkyongensis]|uniref:Uncharacterized protein n=1 Tax=Inhella inkyongensis TaxID=392593 RepID=A0A840SAK8_9BURK|nr:hypothetical protein [Inhella inkyongensis]MBB5206046.1 hypothetical protein [Inhella inkyongensis]
MQFEELDAGDYRIYAGAIERAPGPGFCAALVVVRKAAKGQRDEVFRDEDVGAGYPWPSAQEALRFALQRGRDVVMCRTGLQRSKATQPINA